MYFTIIGIAMVLISATNIIFDVASPIYVVIALVWSVALQFELDGIIALSISKLPDRWFGVDNPHYNVTGREKKLYVKLGVRRWKDKVWELGGLGGFSKKSLRDPSDPRYIEQFIIECNKGVLTHRLSYFIGFLAMLTLPSLAAFTIALPAAAVNLYLNVLPTIVLRYNTPGLKSVLKRLEKKAAREAAKKDLHDFAENVDG